MYHLDKTERETNYCSIFVCYVLQLWTGRGDQDLVALEGKRGPTSNKAAHLQSPKQSTDRRIIRRREKKYQI